MLAVELAWLRAAEIPKVVRVEEILSGAPPGRSGAPRVGPATSAPRAEPSRSGAPPAAAPSPAAAPAAATDSADPSAAETGGPGPAGPADRPLPDRNLLPAFFEQLTTRSPSLAALLKSHRDELRFDGSALRCRRNNRIEKWCIVRRF